MISDKVIVMVLIALMVVCVCGYVSNEINRMEQGTVVDKGYSPGFFYPIASGQTAFMQYSPESYSITISDGRKNYTLSVTGIEYQSISVGDWYNGSVSN